MSRANEYNTQTPDQLNALLTEQRTKLAQMREDQMLGRLKNTAEIAVIRKEIARILTALRNVK